MSTKRRLSDPVDNNSKRSKSTHDDQQHHLSYYSSSQTRPVAFQQPSPLVTFSYDPLRVLEFDDSALRYYVDPPPGADLKYGYDKWIKRPEEKGRIDGLLKAWLKAKEQLPEESMKGAVISWRGVMTKILTAPYEERDGWDLNVMYVDGMFYFEEHTSDEKLREKEDMSPHHRIQSYYGYSFESYCTTSSPNADKQPGWGGDVDTNVQWCSVVKTKLGDTRLLIGGEVDCVRGKLTSNNDTLVELKTSLAIRRPQDESRFEKKLLKFYFQSFLLGVPEIVVGFRTPAGKLTTLQSFKTMQIPRMVRDKPGAWQPGVCLDFGQRFLAFLKTAVQKEDTEFRADTSPKVWRIKFVPRVGVTMTLLDEKGVSEVTADESRYGFLPEWYYDQVKKDTSTRTHGPVMPERLRDTAVVLPPGWMI